jgi:negative regulator of sigma E activity
MGPKSKFKLAVTSNALAGEAAKKLKVNAKQGFSYMYMIYI